LFIITKQIDYSSFSLLLKVSSVWFIFSLVCCSGTITLMADQNPGQIISPGGQSEDSPKTTQEVSVPLQQSIATPLIPPQPQITSPTPQPQPPVTPPQEMLPQQPQVAAPVPQPQPTFQQEVPTPTALPPASQSEPVPTLQDTQERSDYPAEQSFASGFTAPANSEDTYDPYDDSTSFADNSEESISWTASEYIAHQKSPAWFLALALAAVAGSVGVYFITDGDILAIVVIILGAIVFGVFAGKQPKEQTYSISPAGIAVGAKRYTFDQFKTFSIIDDGAFSSITFLPMKRFMPAVSVYYDPKDEEQIVQTLNNYLPMDIYKRDAVDKLMRKIRF
jgi:hypothetical protein